MNTAIPDCLLSFNESFELKMGAPALTMPWQHNDMKYIYLIKNIFNFNSYQACQCHKAGSSTTAHNQHCKCLKIQINNKNKI